MPNGEQPPMNTPRENASPETVTDEDVENAWRGIVGGTLAIGAAIEGMISASIEALRPTDPVHVFTAIDGTTGKPFWHFNREGETVIRVVGQRGERCTECGHVTLENGAAGCCHSVEPIDVAVCPNCETLYAAYDFTPHIRKCYGGRA